MFTATLRQLSAQHLSLVLLEAIYSLQLQPSIRLLSCTMLRWPCSLYPASTVWMTADKSPWLLLASPALCYSTAGECAFSHEAHYHKCTKDTDTNSCQIAPWAPATSFLTFYWQRQLPLFYTCIISHIASVAPRAPPPNTEAAAAAAERDKAVEPHQIQPP